MGVSSLIGTSLVVVATALGATLAPGATVFGPSPYDGFGHSPFTGSEPPQVHLEDFEDGALYTPGVTAVSRDPAGTPTVYGNGGPCQGSVDTDDGVGRIGHRQPRDRPERTVRRHGLLLPTRSSAGRCRPM